MAQSFLELFAHSVSRIDTMSSDMVAMTSCYTNSVFPHRRLAFHQLGESLVKGKAVMTKTLDTISEIIRNPKHPFRKADDRPAKAQKHRYERRKIKEYIKLGSWAQESLA
jgi:hypothetical protein